MEISSLLWLDQSLFIQVPYGGSFPVAHPGCLDTVIRYQCADHIAWPLGWVEAEYGVTQSILGLFLGASNPLCAS